MSGRTRKRSDVEDEARLFGGTYNDPNMTQIRPGQYKPKKKNPVVSLSSLWVRPTLIIECSRQSVLSNLSIELLLAVKVVLYMHKAQQGNHRIVQIIPISPALKNRVVQTNALAKMTEVAACMVDWIAPLNSRPPQTLLARRYPASTPRSQNHVWAHDEFREVEGLVSLGNRPGQHQRRRSATSEDERFMARATRQRQRQLRETNPVSSQNHQALYVEIPNVDTKVSTIAANIPKSSRFPVDDKNTSRDGRGRESPDELQGAVTTDPLPKTLPRKIKPTRTQEVQEVPRSPSRKRSPSDIQQTDFAGSPRQGPKKAKLDHKRSKDSSLEVALFRFGPVERTDANSHIGLEMDDKALELKDAGHGEEPVKILVRHVDKVIQGRQCLKLRMMLKRHDSSIANRVDIEFKTVKSRDRVVQICQKAGVKIATKDASDMQRLFLVNKKIISQLPSPVKRKLPEPEETPPVPAVRRKIASSTPESNSEPAQKRSQTEENTGGRRGSLEGVAQSVPTTHTNTEASPSGEFPVEPQQAQVNNPGPERRSTRRNTHQPPSPETHTPASEVDVDDRDRLREDEFLNDNLIAFYMRFLQDHLERTNPEVAKKVYFFNTYFFEALTKSPKNERGINYNAVAKWTRGVDLFSYDYVVVPINQNAHWYIAIICNLPSLVLDSGDGEEGERGEVAESPVTETVPHTNLAESFKSGPQPAGTPIRYGKKKARGIRYDPKQPIIVTFDSLDLGRSPTVKILRDYICEEAAAKRKSKVNDKDIKGMRAQNIPLQPNWSDCGLYLLAYVEKFTQDPEAFILKVLQKDMALEEDWPPLGSGMLRRRLRDFLDALYREQQARERGEDIKHALADRTPVSFLLGSLPPSKQDGEAPDCPSDGNPVSSPGTGATTNEAVEVPDSQERAKPVSFARQSSSPDRRRTRAEKRRARPATSPADVEVVEVEDSQPGQATAVDVQVRATPPPFWPPG
ncbi:hypothetical protein N7468_008241 [Penicillium chermesinum]|uniref:Ubiquitin-like protease family profile domain-containing protein n=1 Tax=Penicillium chermesinum TaxID=63820 RepID=A0A9W9TIG0_9EURO|nr:uncharacterized protein N7468_008241 [Penicillium chermesinum]KAJ5223699.1 hypothetical protein N7468_008241 [Penicillium chermesinum]